MQELQGAEPSEYTGGADRTLAAPPGSSATVATGRVPTPVAGSAPMGSDAEGGGADVVVFVAVGAAVLLLLVAGVLVTLKKKRANTRAAQNARSARRPAYRDAVRFSFAGLFVCIAHAREVFLVVRVPHAAVSCSNFAGDIVLRSSTED